MMKMLWAQSREEQRRIPLSSFGIPLPGFGTLAKVGIGNVDTPGSCEI
jgi:hypothetical protein